uniref:Chloride channel protein CLC-c n=1 Tax=Aegilops tauschii TaxID=37682 RepID=N1QY25_AEGTA
MAADEPAEPVEVERLMGVHITGAPKLPYHLILSICQEDGKRWGQMDGGQSPRPQQHHRMPEREGNNNYDVEGMDGAAEGDWWQNSSSNALLRYDDRGSACEPLMRKRTINTTSQIAIVGANICPIESLDYEVVENNLFKQDWRSRKKKQIFQYIVIKWTLVLLIGLLTGLVGFFNNLAVENIAGLKLLITSDLMLNQRYFTAFLVYGDSNLVLAAADAAICAYIAPATAGSGIPEVKAYLNGVDAYSILAPSTLFVKIFGSILGVSAGFVLGKEGPMVHTGACIANLLGQGGSCKYHLTCNWLRYFKNDRDRRDLITCGCAAGVAAAFRAPVGGVPFALEEAASWWRSALLWRAFFTTAVVAVVLRTLIEFCRSGKCGLFGQGGLIMFDLSSTVAIYSSPDLLAIILLGIIGGIFGGLFNFLLDKILRIYSIINERGAPSKILLAIIVSVVTSMCSYGLPWLASCTQCPKDAVEQCPTVGRSGNYKNFQCPPGYYNGMASLFFNTNDDATRNGCKFWYWEEYIDILIERNLVHVRALLASIEAVDETSALVAKARHETRYEEATSTSGLKKKGGCNIEPPPQINNECIEKALTQLKGAIMEVGYLLKCILMVVIFFGLALLVKM